MSHRQSSKHEPLKSAKPQTGTPDATQVQVAQPPTTPTAAEGQGTEEKPHPSAELFEQLRIDLEQASQRALRCQAELDNYRKRATRETEERLRYANLSLMRDLLPVLDNIQRAIEASEKSTDGSGLLEGVKMVAQQLQGVLERHHCLKIEALNTPFDPNLHQAILQQSSEEHPANTVIQVIQDGYLLHDRVVRPGQVIVSANSTK
ncbi:MAG TPA: nucleotide exchange factor GrpE [Thermoguttaceae bacterium]